MVLCCCFGVIYIFMSVNIAERPTFEKKELFTLIEVCYLQIKRVKNIYIFLVTSYTFKKNLTLIL